MWKPYLHVIRERCSQALHILDRFHIVAKLNDALDDVRATEARKLAAQGRAPLLQKSRWCLLKRPENLTGTQRGRLRDLVRCNLRTVRAYLLKEDFQHFWLYSSATWAGKFLDQWCTAALRSRLKPLQKVALMLRRHRPLILNWFKAKGQISNGVVEGLNNKAKTHHEKIIRLQITRDPGNRSVSCTWKITAAKTHPRILVTRQFFEYGHRTRRIGRHIARRFGKSAGRFRAV